MQATIQRTEQRFGNAAARRSVLRSAITPASRDALDLLEQFGTTISVHADREIHGQGDAAAYCYRIVTGCVRTVKLMEDGRRQIGEFLMAGDLLGFDALDTFDFAAEAVSDVTLRRYPRRMVDALAESNVALTRRLRDMTSDQPAHWRMPAWSCSAARPRRSGSPASCWRWRSGCRGRMTMCWICRWAARTLPTISA